jgi:hypothetical protein
MVGQTCSRVSLNFIKLKSQIRKESVMNWRYFIITILLSNGLSGGSIHSEVPINYVDGERYSTLIYFKLYSDSLIEKGSKTLVLNSNNSDGLKLISYFNKNNPSLVSYKLRVIDELDQYSLFTPEEGIRFNPFPRITADSIKVKLGNNFSISPNPFNNSIEIQWDKNNYNFEIEIHNILGKNIWSYTPKNYTSSVHWNAIDEKGNEVPTGIYFLNARGMNGGKNIHYREKLLLLK